MDKIERSQMAQMQQEIATTREAVESLDKMLCKAMEVTVQLAQTLKEVKEAQEHHRQTQLDEIAKNDKAHRNAASERSSLASAIERSRRDNGAAERPQSEVRELKSKLENLRTKVVMLEKRGHETTAFPNWILRSRPRPAAHPRDGRWVPLTVGYAGDTGIIYYGDGSEYKVGDVITDERDETLTSPTKPLEPTGKDMYATGGVVQKPVTAII